MSYRQKTPETALVYELNRDRTAVAARIFLELREIEYEVARNAEQQAANAHKKMKKKTPRSKKVLRATLPAMGTI